LHGLDQMMSPGTIIRGVARTQFSDEQRKNFRLHSGWELASLNLEGKIENWTKEGKLRVSAKLGATYVPT